MRGCYRNYRVLEKKKRLKAWMDYYVQEYLGVFFSNMGMDLQHTNELFSDAKKISKKLETE